MSDIGEPGIPVIVRDTLIDVWRAWSELGAALTEEQWKTPSDLPAWTVQDLLSHLVGIERMLQGLSRAPARAAVAGGEPHVRNALGDYNEDEVAARRHLDGTEVLAEWDRLLDDRVATLHTADAAFYAQPMITPVGPGTMTDFLSIRILDCWVHEQDARRALDIPGNEGGAAAEHSIDRLLRTLPMVVGKRAACPEGRAVTLRLHGAVTRDVTCQVDGGRAAVVDRPAMTPLAVVEMDSRDYVMLANGRGDPERVLQRVHVEASEPEGGELGRRVAEGLNVMM